MTRATSKSDPARLLPIVTRAFAELGYRAATTAELARRCKVRENILYRAWPDKKHMFLAAIDHVFEDSVSTWQGLLARHEAGDPARYLLDYEAVHHGEFGLYRIVFVALSETDDPEIRAALRKMYTGFHDFIRRQLPEPAMPAAVDTAWAIVGLGTVSNIIRALNLLPESGRRRLFTTIGRSLLRSP